MEKIYVTMPINLATQICLRFASVEPPSQSVNYILQSRGCKKFSSLVV